MRRRRSPFLRRKLAARMPAMGGANLGWLFNDEHRPPESAPLTSPRSAAPGPGQTIFTDTDEVLSLSDNKLHIAAGPGWTDPGFYDRQNDDSAFTRAAGLAMLFQANMASGVCVVGWNSSQAVDNTVYGFYKAAGAVYLARINGANVTLTSDGTGGDGPFILLQNTDYEIFFILRNNGFFMVWNDELVFVTPTGSNTPLTPTFCNYNAILTSSHRRVVLLPAPWDTDHGICTDRLAGSRNEGDSITHKSNMHMEFTVDALPSAGNIDVEHHRQGGSARYRTLIDSSGIPYIYENSTQRAAGNAGDIANGEHVMTVFNETEIFIHGNDETHCYYRSASSYTNETDSRIASLGTGGAIRDYASYPVNLTGSAKSVLARYRS